MIRSVICVMAVALAVVVCWWTPTMAADAQANVAQTDLVNDWACPPGQLDTPIPDLPLSLTTTGGPLMVMLTLNTFNPLHTTEADMEITPVLDSASRTDDMLRFATFHGDDRGGHVVFSFNRVYPVSSGKHTVSWKVHCFSQLTVLRGWLTVYELPLVKSK